MYIHTYVIPVAIFSLLLVQDFRINSQNIMIIKTKKKSCFFVQYIKGNYIQYIYGSGSLTRWGWDKMAAIWQTTFSNAFSWMKFSVFLFEFIWNIFPGIQLSICQHWFGWWLGTEQVTSHYLNQCWPSLLMSIWVSLPQWVKMVSVWE